MTKIISNANCGNSPKMLFLEKFNNAFAQGNIEFLVDSVTEDITWNRIGDQVIKGIDDFKNELERLQSMKVAELQLYQILTHGKEGAANGLLKMENGKSYAFADFYQFQNTKAEKIKKITSYGIQVE